MSGFSDFFRAFFGDEGFSFSGATGTGVPGSGGSRGQRSGSGGGQRLACAVIGLDRPTREQRRDASGEPAVGGHQRGCLAGRFQCLSKSERDGLRLRSWIGQLGQPNSAQPPLDRLQRLPLVRILRRRHRVRDRPRARRG